MYPRFDVLMPPTVVPCSTTFFLLGNSTVCFRNNFRVDYNRTQQALNYADRNRISNPRDNVNNGLPIRENCQVNLEFDKRSISRLRVRDLVDRIKALSSNERSEVVTDWEKSGNFETISEINDLLMALLIADEPDLALKLFDDMSSHGLVADSWTLSISIRCYCKNKNFDEAERVLGQMLENGLRPNYATIAMLINSLSKSGRLQRALSVLDVMGGVGFKPRVQTYNCLMKGLCYVGRVDEATEMLMAMKKEELNKPDIYSYTVVMNGLCKVGRSDEAFELLSEALEMGLTPDVVAFNTLFNGYCIEGRPMEGIGVLKLMKERNCVPDSISYSTLLYGLLKWGNIGTALSVYDEMIGIGLKVEDKMLNTLLIGLCRKFCKGKKDYLEIAHQLFEKMKHDGSVVNPSAHDVMIQTLCIGKKTDEASFNLQKMIRMGYSPRMITFNGVIRALCGEGKVIEALFVLVLLNEVGRVPSRTCYNLLIDELYKCGNVLGACSVYGAAVKRDVIPSKEPQQ